MATVMSFTAVSLLLLMCGPLLQSVSAGDARELMMNPFLGLQPLDTEPASSVKALDAVSRISGIYSNHAQVYEQLTQYNETQIHHMTLLYLPRDIPSLNHHYPVFHVEQDHTSGSAVRAGVILFYDDFTIAGYYNLTDIDDYVSGKDMTGLTLNDLNNEAFCMALVTLQNGEVTFDKVCKNPHDADEYITSLPTHICTSLTVTLGPGTPKKYTGVPFQFQKIRQFPLPASWLVGNEDYVSPCAV